MTAPAIGSGHKKYVKADFRRQDFPIYASASGPFRSDCLFRIEENERELTAVGPSADGPVSSNKGRLATIEVSETPSIRFRP